MTTPTTRFGQTSDTTAVVEVGPRMSFSTAWSANAVSICHSCGLSNITRIEKSYRYQLQSSKAVSQQQQLAFAAMVSFHETIWLLTARGSWSRCVMHFTAHTDLCCVDKLCKHATIFCLPTWTAALQFVQCGRASQLCIRIVQCNGCDATSLC